MPARSIRRSTTRSRPRRSRAEPHRALWLLAPGKGTTHALLSPSRPIARLEPCRRRMRGCFIADAGLINNAGHARGIVRAQRFGGVRHLLRRGRPSRLDDSTHRSPTRQRWRERRDCGAHRRPVVCSSPRCVGPGARRRAGQQFARLRSGAPDHADRARCTAESWCRARRGQGGDRPDQVGGCRCRVRTREYVPSLLSHAGARAWKGGLPVGHLQSAVGSPRVFCPADRPSRATTSDFVRDPAVYGRRSLGSAASRAGLNPKHRIPDAPIIVSPPMP